MTAMTLDALSGGRFILGLGPSGPQVVEGWHGVPYGKPLTRTREYIDDHAQIFAREEPLEFEGEHYQIPYAGPGATGLGKPLKSILHGRSQHPDLHRLDRAGRARSGGRDRRRLPPDLDEPRAPTCSMSRCRGLRRRPAAARARQLRRRAVRALILGDDLDAAACR